MRGLKRSLSLARPDQFALASRAEFEPDPSVCLEQIDRAKDGIERVTMLAKLALRGDNYREQEIPFQLQGQQQTVAAGDAHERLRAISTSDRHQIRIAVSRFQRIVGGCPDKGVNQAGGIARADGDDLRFGQDRHIHHQRRRWESRRHRPARPRDPDHY